jgi:type II secretory pathway pseudopilin PulG
MNKFQPMKRQGERGISLVETMIGLMILVLAAGSVFAGLLQMNRVASVARLYTAAQFIVQSKINQIQIDGPFVPQNGLIPASLAFISGTASVTTNYPIYADPATGNTLVSGTLSISGQNLTMYAYATVELIYSYRNKNFDVIESTVRASDQQ